MTFVQNVLLAQNTMVILPDRRFAGVGWPSWLMDGHVQKRHMASFVDEHLGG